MRTKVLQGATPLQHSVVRYNPLVDDILQFPHSGGEDVEERASQGREHCRGQSSRVLRDSRSAVEVRDDELTEDDVGRVQADTLRCNPRHVRAVGVIELWPHRCVVATVTPVLVQQRWQSRISRRWNAS